MVVETLYPGPAPPTPTPTPPAPPPIPTGALSVSNGVILLDGQPFVFIGIAVLYSDDSPTPATPASIRTLFPAANTIMLALGADGNGYADAPSNAAILAYVVAANAAGFWVGLSDYVSGQPPVRSGADLANSLLWYSALAAETSNCKVFWTTENEVSGNLDAMVMGVYNAIRGAGNGGLILIEPNLQVTGNSPPTTITDLSPGVVSGMNRVCWNFHCYPWLYLAPLVSPAFTTQSQFNDQTQNYAGVFSLHGQSLDGVMPVVMGEGGNATQGNGGPIDDPIIGGVFATVQSWLNAIGNPVFLPTDPGLSGGIAWIHDWFGETGDADTLVVSGALTTYGTQVEAGFAAL